MNTSAFFELRVLRHHWIKDEGDDPADLCSHGTVFLRIGSDIVCDENTFDITTSSAAIHLMRTLKDDYIPGKYAAQLLPCCGHFIVTDDDLDYANICGCPSGVDWNVTHLKSGFIKLETEKGTTFLVPFNDYKAQVLAFADSVEQFYKKSAAKIIPEDDFDRNGYTALWNEWHNLRKEWV